MKTLHIKVRNKETYDHLLWFLEKFNEDEIQFLEGKTTFTSIKKDLNEELRAIDSEESTLMELDEFDKELDEIITKNEN